MLSTSHQSVPSGAVALLVRDVFSSGGLRAQTAASTTHGCRFQRCPWCCGAMWHARTVSSTIPRSLWSRWAAIHPVPLCAPPYRQKRAMILRQLSHTARGRGKFVRTYRRILRSWCSVNWRQHQRPTMPMVARPTGPTIGCRCFSRSPPSIAATLGGILGFAYSPASVRMPE